MVGRLNCEIQIGMIVSSGCAWAVQSRAMRLAISWYCLGLSTCLFKPAGIYRSWLIEEIVLRRSHGEGRLERMSFEMNSSSG